MGEVLFKSRETRFKLFHPFVDKKLSEDTTAT